VRDHRRFRLRFADRKRADARRHLAVDRGDRVAQQSISRPILQRDEVKGPPMHMAVIASIRGLAKRTLPASSKTQNINSRDEQRRARAPGDSPNLLEDVGQISTISAPRRKGGAEGDPGCRSRLGFLPKYSPDLNPIEQVFAKFTKRPDVGFSSAGRQICEGGSDPSLVEDLLYVA
jgi:hypothetical protein